MNQRTDQPGFSVLELLIVVVIIVALGAIAIPSFQNYLRRTYYSEIVQTAKTYQAAVNVCAEKTKSFVSCNAGNNKIPVGINHPAGAIASLSVIQGVISIVPVAKDGVTPSDTYILTPGIDAKSGNVKWVVSGGAVTRELVD